MFTGPPPPQLYVRHRGEPHRARFPHASTLLSRLCEDDRLIMAPPQPCPPSPPPPSPTQVPDGAKPGDPIKVRLPDGVTVVKITVPDGAGPGTTLEFELPSDDPPPKPAPAPAPMDENTAVPARLHSEEKAKLTAGSDLTNTTGEKIYVITLPQGVVPGKPIVAEIMDGSGATVLVPVPRGARPGRELLFRVQGGLEDENAPKTKVYRKGSLKKVSPKSMSNMVKLRDAHSELLRLSLLPVPPHPRC